MLPTVGNEEDNNSPGENVTKISKENNGQEEMTSSSRRPIKITLFKNGDPWSGGYTFFFSPKSLVIRLHIFSTNNVNDMLLMLSATRCDQILQIHL